MFDANSLVSKFLKFVLSWLSYVFIIHVSFERNKQNKYQNVKILKQKPFLNDLVDSFYGIMIQ